jgi:hypothetical protein
MSETKFKERVLKDLKALSCSWVLKTQERSRRGVPDIIACLNGGFCAIELKDTGKKADMLQDITLKRICQAKGVSIVSTPERWEMHYDAIREFFYGS